MEVGLGGNAARINVAEIVTALWTFAHAQGLLTDDINERTGGVGVTVGGVQMLNAAVRMLGLPLFTTNILLTTVFGDSDGRYSINAAGRMEWGDGASARDTNLFRDAADVLKTDDSLEVAGASGVITDDITERTVDAGVAIDGVTMLDGRVRKEDAPLAADTFIRSKVLGDADLRFFIRINGEHNWGDGTNPPDTSLFRDAANQLKTDDSFDVARRLRALQRFVVSSKNIAVVSGNNNNVDTGDEVYMRISSNNDAADITGFNGGEAGRIIIVVNTDAGFLFELKHESASSTAANRLSLPGAIDYTITIREGATLIYDGTDSRWKYLREI